MALGTDVAIQLGKGRKKGKIAISFSSEAEFERLLSILTEEKEDTPRSPLSSFHI